MTGGRRWVVVKAMEMLSGPDFCSKNGYTFLLQECGKSGSLDEGKQVHEHLCKSPLSRNVFLLNHVVNMYGMCGDVPEAQKVFRGIEWKSVYSWNIMIAAYAQNGYYLRAVRLFQEMLQDGGIAPDNITFINTLAACCDPVPVNAGRSIHRNLLESRFLSDVVVGTSLVTFYGRFKLVDEALAVFRAMPVKNVVSWTSIITACRDDETKALQMYAEMLREHVKPDRVTMISVLDSCVTLTYGESLHSHVFEKKFHTDVSVMNALLTMYARCGSLDRASRVFDLLRGSANEVSWSAIIAAYAQNGHVGKVLELVRLMALSGMNPNEITFINVLFACSHAGSIREALESFILMVGDFYVTPVLDHYSCLLDLLGRVGHLLQAQELLKDQPFQPHRLMWKSLLSACEIHGNLDLGEKAAAVAGAP